MMNLFLRSSVLRKISILRNKIFWDFIMNNKYDNAPQLLKDYLVYLQLVKNRSELTVLNYYTDLRTFFRFYKTKPDVRQMIRRNFRISALLTSRKPI